MENMDKGQTVPKWVLIVWPKRPQNLFAQAQKWDFDEKKASWGVRCPWTGRSIKEWNFKKEIPQRLA